MKKFYTSALFVLNFALAIAQTGTGIGAKVVDSKTFKPLQNVVASIQNTNLTELTDATGNFVFKNVPTGKGLLQLRLNGYKDQLMEINIEQGKIQSIGTIQFVEDITEEQQISLVTITDNDLGDESSGSESTAALLQASRDAFLQAAAFNFGQARFSVRGIDNEYSNVMINGISMNRLSDGRPQYSNWGGLNDATRNQEFTDGSKPSDYVFSGIAGSQEINTRASVYRPGTRLSFLNNNTNYSFRAMGTTASGMMNNGWAYVFSAGRRWAQEGYFEGSTYSANSIFASVEKRINSNHSLNFTTMYAQNRRGKNSPNTEEINNLVGVKYNSYWGYQDGEKRNSRVKEVNEPISILSHYWKVSPTTNINTSVSYQLGSIGNSRIDFQSSDNPDPTYYRNLPSYYTTLFINNVYAPNNDGAESIKTTFLSQPQLDWKSLYKTNSDNIANGSRFVLYEDRTDEKTFSFNSIISSLLANNITLNGGFSYIDNKSSNFKNLLDLLGGSYFNDKNLFGQQIGQNQNDLNNPDRKVIVGDKYGYNYDINSSKLEAFTQFKFTYKKVDFYLAQSFSKSTYQRDGKYRNGYYPNNSFGESDAKEFDNFGFKTGLTYKISGRQYLDFNALYQSKAPNSKDVFPNVRLNNLTTPNLTNETITSFDASYIIRAPSFKARITGYVNEIKNSTDIAFYFSDNINTGVNASGFLSELVTGQNKRNRGIEFGAEYQITSTLKATAIAAYGEYIYTNNPKLTTTNDATGIPFERGEINQSGYKVGGLPQQAYSFGLEYRDPKFWWIGSNINYLSNNYIDFAPLLRTSTFKNFSNSAVVQYDQTLADKYLEQEKFNPFYLLNVVGGKSWRIARKYNIGLFANINNVLDAKYKTGGFEQARNATFSELYKDNQGPAKSFGNKYFYGYGRTYTVNVYFTF